MNENTLSVSLGCLDVSATVKWNMDYFLGEVQILSSHPYALFHIWCALGAITENL